MSVLSDSVIETTLDRVEVVYVNQDIRRRWNQSRKPGELSLCCGHYWLHGSDEAGPFQSRSAAIRDAYYRVIKLREPPEVGRVVRQSNRTPRRRATTRLRVVA